MIRCSLVGRTMMLATWAISFGNSIAGEVSSFRAQRKSDVVDHPSGCIAIHQEKDGPIRFEVYVVDASTQRLVPIEAYRITVAVLGKQPPVWEAEGANYSAAHRITYGVNPNGFHAQIPPEQLLPGVKYKVNVRSYNVGGIQRTFLHEGVEKRNTCPWDGNPQD